jgi:hypothetical protein
MSLPDDRLQTDRAQPEMTPPPEGPGRDAGSPLEAAAASFSATRAWLIILAAGLVAGLAGFAFGEATPKLVPPALDLPPEIRAVPTSVPIETERRMGIARDRAAALAYGGLGLVLGLALGVAGGLARESPRAAIVAGLAGLILGGAAGAGSTLALLPSYHAARAAAPDEESSNDLALALRTHGGIFIAVGAAAGLALGLGLGGGARTARAFFGGVLGAALAAVIYEFGGALVFPVAQTFRPMAVTPWPRLLAHLSVALCVSAGALGAAQHLQLRRAAPHRDRTSTQTT